MSDVADSVREAFSGKRGKILLIGGGLAVVGYVWWYRTTGAGDPPPEEEEGTGEYGGTSGGSGRVPQSQPEVGNDNQGSTTPPRPTTNIGWLTAATEYLIGRGVSPAGAYTALSKALGGEALSTVEMAWVSQAIAGIGTPPEGMPPLQAAPAKPPTQTPTTPKPTTPTTPKPKPKPTAPAAKYTAVRVVKYTSKNPPWNSTLSGIAKRYGKSWTSVWNDSRNASLRARRKSPSKIRPGDVVYVRTN